MHLPERTGLASPTALPAFDSVRPQSGENQIRSLRAFGARLKSPIDDFVQTPVLAVG